MVVAAARAVPDQIVTAVFGFEELREDCTDALGPYKTPKRFYFVDELPKGPSGKVQRLKLLDLVAPG